MNLELFISRIRNGVPVWTAFENPGGGTSIVLKITDKAIAYRRGKSSISVPFQDIFKAYAAFQGQRVSSSDLKMFAPSVFDPQARPAGHSCNATFLFLVLQRIGSVAGRIEGNGVKGDPYYVHINRGS
jgi:hypothetical protein